MGVVAPGKKKGIKYILEDLTVPQLIPPPKFHYQIYILAITPRTIRIGLKFR